MYTPWTTCFSDKFRRNRRSFGDGRAKHGLHGRTVSLLCSVQQLSDKRPAPASFANFLAQEHRGLKPLILDAAGMNSLFAEYRTDPARWYLVDPSGWVMMSYSRGNSYKDVIADLKFLLNNSGD